MMVRSGQLDWLLVEFVRDTPGVVHGVVVSGDGLRLATSPGVGTTLGDQLAAAASGLISLARGTAHLLNAGALTHTSLALYDAIRSIRTPVIEVHISNPAAREAYRHKSYVAMAAKGTIAGFGSYGYELALEAASRL